MARDDPHFRLRVPEHLRNDVAKLAREHGRSINAEVIQALTHWVAEAKSEVYLSPDPPPAGKLEDVVQLMSRTMIDAIQADPALKEWFGKTDQKLKQRDDPEGAN